MWIKIEFVDNGEKSLLLPLEMAKTLQTPAKLVFGSRYEMVNVICHTKLSYKENSSFMEQS